MFVIVINSLFKYYVGHRLLSEIYVMLTAFLGQILSWKANSRLADQ